MVSVWGFSSAVGLVAELYYVREGVINSYALDFTVPVPANFTYIYFTWRSTIKRPVQYMAHMEYDNGEAMALPQLNISNKGLVPPRPETFRAYSRLFIVYSQAITPTRRPSLLPELQNLLKRIL
ncbi:tyrosine-protein kinase Drl-like [Palaemon carinicauda]|uniref:tyrosine-protein kinase Drl-like n=1 Tax=Palaemon carinicauda TaxID=392227 RepID=UPI0035B64EC3